MDINNLIKNEYLIFIIAFLPGISSDPLGNTSININLNLNDKEEQINYPGIGLPILLDAVCNIFDGKLAVRSDNYLINFTKDKSSIRTKKFYSNYRAHIKKFPSFYPTFNGNLLAIHLPLKPKE